MLLIWDLSPGFEADFRHYRISGQSKAAPWTSVESGLSMSIKPEQALAVLLSLRDVLGGLSRPYLKTERTEERLFLE